MKLMFEPVDVSNTCYATCWGTDFQPVSCPTNCLDLRWITDGDGRHAPETRWGVFALVTPDSVAPQAKQVEALAEKWLRETQKVRGPEAGL